jgi:hypothetical protein
MAAEKWFYIFAGSPIGLFLKKLRTRLFHWGEMPLGDGNSLSSLNIKISEAESKSCKNGLRG